MIHIQVQWVQQQKVKLLNTPPKKLSTDWANRLLLLKKTDSECKSSSLWKSGA